MNSAVQDLIQSLRLESHPEGGYYRETYRAPGQIPQSVLPRRFNGNRAFSTAILFLLESGSFSGFHRLAADECWHFYQGLPLHIYVLEQGASLTVVKLGSNPREGEVFQAVIPAGRWFAAKPIGTEGFSLTGCTVAPGFDFQDFDMGEADALAKEFPGHAELIRSLTRPPTATSPPTP